MLKEIVWNTCYLRDQTPLRYGVSLAVDSWASIVLVHGQGEHSLRYQRMVEVLNEMGLDVLLYDQRGHGASGGRKGYIPYLEALSDDLLEIWRIARTQFATKPLFLLGHSMGGTVACRAIARGLLRPDALLLSSPALKLVLSRVQQMVLWVMLKLMPNFVVPNGLKPDYLSHDQKVIAEYQNDPLVHDRISFKVIAVMNNAFYTVIRNWRRFDMPILMQVAGADRIVDPLGAQKVFTAISVHGLTTFLWYHAGYHEIFNEDPVRREEVLQDLRNWLQERKCRMQKTGHVS